MLLRRGFALQCFNLTYIILLSAGALSVLVADLSSTSILLKFILIEGVEPSEYTIIYSNTNPQCFNDSRTLAITNASTVCYNITDLEEGTEYNITVILAQADGARYRDTTTATTATAGKSYIYI